MVNVILIGPQGSGKGTQSEMIVREFDLTHIEAGAMIRKRAEFHDRKAEIINHLANNKGILLPDGIVLDMIFDEIEEHGTVKGYLFDGFPRSLKQYEALKEFGHSNGFTLNAAIFLFITEAETKLRILNRRICSKCKKGYNLLLTPNLKQCTCGGALVSRKDDTPDAIDRRLKEYHTQTEPILSEMKKDNILFEIDGSNNLNEISIRIRNIIIQFS